MPWGKHAVSATGKFEIPLQSMRPTKGCLDAILFGAADENLLLNSYHRDKVGTDGTVSRRKMPRGGKMSVYAD